VGPLQGRGRRRHSVPHDSRRRHAGLLRARLGHNAKGQYSERPDDYVDNMDRLSRKFETGAPVVPKPEIDGAGAKIGFIGYGTSHWAIGESRDQLREETDVKTSYFRLRAYPFTESSAAFIDAHERVYVIEQNRDAQLLQLMKLE
jgi:2-oxoglutarate ferredoxin oxidoreductase subunit alpha